MSMRSKSLYFFVLCALMVSTCGVHQLTLSQNEIFVTDQKHYGVKSSKGKVIIPPVYFKIFPYIDIFKNYYEQERREILESYPYYIVINQKRERAIFATNGRQLFDFIEADGLEIDQPTQTVVVHLNQRRPSQARLYYLNGKIADTSSYQRIGYFPANDLIILEKIKREEVYLLNIDQGQKAGPYDHFNLWESYGMLAVRYQDRWGLIDETGEELLPLMYTRLWLMNEEFARSPFYSRATKPENITFIGGATLADGETRILLDETLQAYSISVRAGKVSIAKMIE